METSGGIRRAQIPLCFRVREGDNAESIAQRLQRKAGRLTSQMGGVAVAVAVREEDQRQYTGKATRGRKVVQAWCIDPSSRLVETSQQALWDAGISASIGKWRLGRLGTGTAGGVLVNEFGVPTIGFGPGHEDQTHAVDEHVSVESIGTAVYGTVAICHALIVVPTPEETDRGTRSSNRETAGAAGMRPQPVEGSVG